MPEVSTGEYLNSLLIAWQEAEKVHNQAVSDLIAAEIRRDEAQTARDAAFARLEEARTKLGEDKAGVEGAPSDQRKSMSKTPSGGQQLQKAPSNRNVGRTPSGGRKKMGVRASSFSKRPARQSNSNKQAGETNTASGVEEKTTSPTPEEAPRKKRQQPSVEKAPGSSLDETPNQPPQPQPKKEEQKEEEEEEEEVPSRGLATKARSTSSLLHSPATGRKKAPRIFQKGNSDRRLNGSGAPKQRKTSKVSPAVRTLDFAVNVMDISKGHPAEWFASKNTPWEQLGLVRNFYRATFGTMTNGKTNEFSVVTIVLKDDWNDLAIETSEVQSLYIGKSTSEKPTLKDKAAKALVRPPQREPVALFYQKGKLIHYGGHWKVVDGDMLNPPRDVKGNPRQCLVKFQCVGVSDAIIQALNQE